MPAGACVVGKIDTTRSLWCFGRGNSAADGTSHAGSEVIDYCVKAVRVGLVDVAKRRDVDAIWVGRVDDDLADLARVGESDVVPGFARVRRLEQANPIRVLATDVGFAGSYVNDVRVGGRDRYRSNR